MSLNSKSRLSEDLISGKSFKGRFDHVLVDAIRAGQINTSKKPEPQWKANRTAEHCKTSRLADIEITFQIATQSDIPMLADQSQDGKRKRRKLNTDNEDSSCEAALSSEQQGSATRLLRWAVSRVVLTAQTGAWESLLLPTAPSSASLSSVPLSGLIDLRGWEPATVDLFVDFVYLGPSIVELPYRLQWVEGDSGSNERPPVTSAFSDIKLLFASFYQLATLFGSHTAKLFALQQIRQRLFKEVVADYPMNFGVLFESIQMLDSCPKNEELMVLFATSISLKLSEIIEKNMYGDLKNILSTCPAFEQSWRLLDKDIRDKKGSRRATQIDQAEEELLSRNNGNAGESISQLPAPIDQARAEPLHSANDNANASTPQDTANIASAGVCETPVETSGPPARSRRRKRKLYVQDSSKDKKETPYIPGRAYARLPSDTRKRSPFATLTIKRQQADNVEDHGEGLQPPQTPSLTPSGTDVISSVMQAWRMSRPQDPVISHTSPSPPAQVTARSLGPDEHAQPGQHAEDRDDGNDSQPSYQQSSAAVDSSGEDQASRSGGIAPSQDLSIDGHQSGALGVEPSETVDQWSTSPVDQIANLQDSSIGNQESGALTAQTSELIDQQPVHRLNHVADLPDHSLDCRGSDLPSNIQSSFANTQTQSATDDHCDIDDTDMDDAPSMPLPEGFDSSSTQTFPDQEPARFNSTGSPDPLTYSLEHQVPPQSDPHVQPAPSTDIGDLPNAPTDQGPISNAPAMDDLADAFGGWS